MDERYYQHYDLMFSEKDYAGEVATLVGIYRDHMGRPPERVLDLGCGTGNHARQLRDCGCSVWAWDSDEKMLALARLKLAGVRFGLPSHNVRMDMVVSMFHVANYCLAVPDLLALFNLARRVLRPGGLFIFDAWDTSILASDPPKDHYYEHQYDGLGVCRWARPLYWLDYDLVCVNNDTQINNHGNLVDRFSWEYSHRMWTPVVIADCLEMVGFSDSQAPAQPWGKRGLLFMGVK